jgi:hypothetical protein
MAYKLALKYIRTDVEQIGIYIIPIKIRIPDPELGLVCAEKLDPDPV